MTRDNLQEIFLHTLYKERIAVTLFLTNGFQLRGIITGYDNYAIVIVSENQQQMIYKHAISTIAPTRAIVFSTNDN